MDIDIGIVPPNECNISTGNTQKKISIYLYFKVCDDIRDELSHLKLVLERYMSPNFFGLFVKKVNKNNIIYCKTERFFFVLNYFILSITQFVESTKQEEKNKSICATFLSLILFVSSLSTYLSLNPSIYLGAGFVVEQAGQGAEPGDSSTWAEV